MALGNMGLGRKNEAERFLKEALVVEPSHMMCRVYEKLVGKMTV